MFGIKSYELKVKSFYFLTLNFSFLIAVIAVPLGGVAQLGERLPCTQEVIGSIPFTSTMTTTVKSYELKV